jgi:streptomycin 6-kinase
MRGFILRMIEHWRRRAPALAQECAELWSLALGERYDYSFVSIAVRAELPDGTPAVRILLTA